MLSTASMGGDELAGNELETSLSSTKQVRGGAWGDLSGAVALWRLEALTAPRGSAEWDDRQTRHWGWLQWWLGSLGVAAVPLSSVRVDLGKRRVSLLC